MQGSSSDGAPGRKSYSAYMHEYRWWVYGYAAIVLGLFAAFILWVAAAWYGSNDSGSPELAEEWRVHLMQFADPNTAKASDPEIIVLRFRNGEWVFGRSQSSHGIWRQGGGTIVVRDSSGQTRAFFGHVCGEGHLAFGNPPLPSLAEYYREMTYGSRFTEYRFK